MDIEEARACAAAGGQILIASDADVCRHLSQHKKPSTCYACAFGKHRRHWLTTLPMLVDDVDIAAVPADMRLRLRPTWAAVLTTGEGLDSKRLWCMACEKFLAPPHRIIHAQLRKHHESQSHKSAVRNLLQIEVGPHGLSIAGAPAVDAFMAVWDVAPNTRAIPGIGEVRKIRHMQHCLREALVQRDREFLKEAGAITLIRDESKGMLVIRFLASSDSLPRRAGLLGAMRMGGSDAFDIIDATRAIVADFCKPAVAPDTKRATTLSLRRRTAI